MKNKNLNKILVLFLVIFSLLTSSCNESDKDYIKKEVGKVVTNEAKRIIDEASDKISKELLDKLEELKKNVNIDSNNTINTTKSDIKDFEKLKFNNYYCKNGKSNIVLDIPKLGEVVYGKLDKLGRPTYVIANINNKMRNEAKQRGRFPINLDPIGWYDNKEVIIKEKNGQTYYGYFYNRSHMLADSLGGLPIAENLVTGTRTQNVGINNKGGMAYAEIKARKYLDNHENVELIYQVRNIYFENELIPRYTTIDMISKDKSIDEEVIVCNSANGYTINYKTGKYYKK